LCGAGRRRVRESRAGRPRRARRVEDEGWGAIQLPPAWYPDDVAAQLLDQVAEHVDEFERHGYDVVLVGARTGLAEALDTIGATLPDATVPSAALEL
jgi:hypothetical protein